MITVITLLGRQDKPTDGVEHYCSFLGEALARLGIELKSTRIPWVEKGWLSAFKELWQDTRRWRGAWVLIQYTALGWSKRGFPFGVLAVQAILKLRGARCAVVFHESSRQGRGLRPIDRIRGACQDGVIRSLYRGATKAVFTTPLETIGWVSGEDTKATFIPIGANIPECLHRRQPSGLDEEKTITIFGITGPPETSREIEEIVAIVRETKRFIPKLHLMVIGRGSMESREHLVKGLESYDVKVSVLGILPAEDITHKFICSDVLLFVRRAIGPQRGSAIGGIACGLPIVGYRDEKMSELIEKAGIETYVLGDRAALTSGLVQILTDPRRWLDLHERNIYAQETYFSWKRIAEQYRGIVGG